MLIDIRCAWRTPSSMSVTSHVSDCACGDWWSLWTQIWRRIGLRRAGGDNGWGRPAEPGKNEPQIVPQPTYNVP